LFFVWRDQTRRPEAWRRRLAEPRWRRVLLWAILVLAAVVLGVGLAGGVDAALDALLPGLAVVGLLFVAWSWSKAFGSRER
jgi:Zn-dependent protease with chaperone function